MDRTAILITLRTGPGLRGKLRSVWDKHLRARVETCDAQELYLVVEDQADPDVLHLVEMYNDPQQAQANAAAPWFADYLAAAAPLLGGPPVMATGVPVWAKGVPV